MSNPADLMSRRRLLARLALGAGLAYAAPALAGVDVALDMVGAPYLDATLKALNPGGRLVYIAAQGGNVLQLPVATVMRTVPLPFGVTRPSWDTCAMPGLLLVQVTEVRAVGGTSVALSFSVSVTSSGTTSP